jgi:hypothetical protein
VVAINKALTLGFDYGHLGAKYNVSPHTIRDFDAGNTWKHLNLRLGMGRRRVNTKAAVASPPAVV